MACMTQFVVDSDCLNTSDIVYTWMVASV